MALSVEGPPPPPHAKVVELATQLLVAEAVAGRWYTSNPGAEAAVRAQLAYRTAQIYLAAFEELRP